MILNQGAYFLLAFATIGMLLSAAFFIPNVDGALSEAAIRVKKLASPLATLWFLTTLIGIILKVSQIFEVSILESLNRETLTPFLTETDIGKSMFAQLVGVLIVAAALPLIKRAIPLVIFTGISIVVLVIPIFQSHAAASGSHSLAIGALVVHVAAISLWVGALFGILATPVEQRITALYRFSALALWAAILVSLSGAATAWTRLKDPETWTSQYAYVVIAKVIFTVALLVMGYSNRKRLESRDSIKLQELLRLIGVEAMVMVGVVLMGSWLSQIQPPSGDFSQITSAELIVGMKTPPAPNLLNLIKLHNPDALMIALLVIAVLLYIKGVAILK